MRRLPMLAAALTTASVAASPAAADSLVYTKAVNPSWSSDGAMLACTAPDGLHVVNPDCSGDRRLVAGATGAAFGPADAGASRSGPAGVNSVRFKKRLKPGRHLLRVSAGTTSTAKFRVKR